MLDFELLSMGKNIFRIAAMSFVRLQMILGPWTHGEHARTFSGDVDFGPQSTFDRNVAATFQVFFTLMGGVSC